MEMVYYFVSNIICFAIYDYHFILWFSFVNK